MAELLDLSSETIASTFDQLLHIGQTEGLLGGGSEHYITDGDGTPSIMSLGTARVGIGTDSPGVLLDVSTATNAVGTATIKIQTTADANPAYANLFFASGAGDLAQITGRQESAQAHGSLAFYVRNGDAAGLVEGMRLLHNGHVGIGKVDPVHELTIAATTTSGPALELQFDSSGVLIDQELGEIIFSGNDSGINAGGGSQSDESSIGAKIIASCNGTWGSTNDADDSPAKIQFFTQDDSATDTLGTARMTIDKDGNVGIAQSVPREKLDITGQTISTEGYYIGEWHVDKLLDDAAGAGSTQTCYIGNQAITTSSDMRIKENIVDTSSIGLDVVSKFRVVDFTWNDPTDQCPNNRNARGIWTGFLAQEAIEVAPYSVNAPRIDGKEIDMDSKSTWMMDYGQLVPILTKAIQELTVKVEALENNNKQGDSSNEQEESAANSGGSNGGNTSSDSSGQDSGGAEGNSSESSEPTEGASGDSESVSGDAESGDDDGDEASGGSGGNSADVAEGGSGEDGNRTQSFPAGEPSDEWTKDELKFYMETNEIAFNSGDTKQDLLDKIGSFDG